MKGNSGFIDPIDPASDYLPDQLRFLLNQLKLRCKQYTISDSHHIKTFVDSLKSEARVRLTLRHIRTTMKF
jgi:hypothetical protein